VGLVGAWVGFLDGVDFVHDTQRIYCYNSSELIYAYTYFQSGGGGVMRLSRVMT